VRVAVLDAWILACDPELASEVASAVTEVGYTPRRASTNGTGRPTVEDGGANRQPGVVLVVATPGEPVPTAVCEQVLEHEGLATVPVMLALDEEHLIERPDVSGVHELIVRPFTAAELGVRIQRARSQSGGIDNDEIVRIGTLEVNLATYQVSITERPVDFTYMEYELLKFLVTNPARVFSREALLSAVWGYDYYGGARTVDVHVRRVRAKLGQEHASRIRTVRGVGYRFER
jgi:DNA-binding response OmpR family regulator